MREDQNQACSGVLGGAVEANKIRNLDGCGMSERVSAKGLIRQRVRQLTKQARGLEALAASLPEEMNPQAEAALMDMFR